MIERSGRQYTCARAVWVLALGLFLSAAGPAAAQTIFVPAGGDLQAALDAVQPGGTVLLEAGATFVGKYTISAKENPDGLYVTVRSSASDADLPAPGTRINPTYAQHLPKIQSTDQLQGLYVAPGASYVRIECVEFLANVNGQGDILRVGNGSETVAANQPHHIVLDRIYVHGDPTIGQKNGVVAHAAEFTLRESWISDIKLVSIETHAFSSYNGPGPYLIENNYLEAASINVMFGGTDPRNADLQPADITIRGNHIAKNPEWMRPRPDGRFWNVKNLLELKIGRRVTIEANVLEYNWFGAGDQSGHAVLLRSESQSGSCTFCETGPVLFQNNIVRHTPAGFNLVGLDFNSTPAGVRMHDVVIRNNLFDDVNRTTWSIGTATSARWAHVNGVVRLTFDHNTLIMPGQTGVIAFNGSADSTDFVYTNNMSEHKSFGLKGDGTVIGNPSLTAYTVGHTVLANVLAGGTASSYPAGNFFPTVATWLAGFVDYAGGNYRLGDISPYNNAGTDGTDLGANIDAVEAAVPATNGRPVAPSQTLSTLEDTPLAVVLTGSDPDGDPITFQLGTPAHGTLSGTPPNVIYTPAVNYNGSDSFSFFVDDDEGYRGTGTVTLSVTSVNDAPVANDLAVTTRQGNSIRFTLDATDPDGDTLTYDVPSTIPSGTLTLVDGSTYEYTPDPAFSGIDTFVYSVADPSLASASATVTLTVTPDGPPVANPQSVATSEDVPVSFTLDASDPGDDPKTYTVGVPAHGTLSGVAPDLTYTPNANFNGADSFTYTVADDDGEATATVSLTVAAVNDAPVVTPIAVTTPSGTPVAIVLNGSDVDGDALTWSVAAPQYGSLSGTPPNVTYTSFGGFVGTDSFTFTASDGIASAAETVTVQVTGVPVTINAGFLIDGRVDKKYSQNMQANGGASPYTWSIASGVLPPGLTLAADTGRISGVPTTAGTYSFVVQVSDRWNQTHARPFSIVIVARR